MPENDSKVIGVFAYRSRMEVVCTDVDACVITGSEEAMRRHFEQVESGSVDGLTIKKTRFGEIMQGLIAGGAYAFDQHAYARFLPLAREFGIPIILKEFPLEASTQHRFLTVRFVSDARRV